MKELIELTDLCAKKIAESEEQKKKLGDFLKEVNSSVNLTLGTEIFEEKIIVPVKTIELNELKIAGVDGGLVKRSLHGIDIMLLRAVGVLFNYKDNKLANVEYFPDALPSPIPKVVFDPFSDVELEINSNMERQIVEIDTATKVVEKFKPHILFLNGSIVPHYSERPANNSPLKLTFEKMIESYTSLYSTIKHNDTILAGVIEDSRGIRFCEVVNQKILQGIQNIDSVKVLLNKTRDSNLLSHVLNRGERSFVFKYSTNPEDHPVLKEFGGQTANQMFSFYVKTAEFDRPIRVDFLADKGIVAIANKISSILLALTGHSGYGIPSVIIEADQRAKLTEKDLELFYLDLINKVGNIPGIMNLRREQRPF
jgi:hypothetical protein